MAENKERYTDFLWIATPHRKSSLHVSSSSLVIAFANLIRRRSRSSSKRNLAGCHCCGGSRLWPRHTGREEHNRTFICMRMPASFTISWIVGTITHTREFVILRYYHTMIIQFCVWTVRIVHSTRKGWILCHYARYYKQVVFFRIDFKDDKNSKLACHLYVLLRVEIFSSRMHSHSLSS